MADYGNAPMVHVPSSNSSEYIAVFKNLYQNPSDDVIIKVIMPKDISKKRENQLALREYLVSIGLKYGNVCSCCRGYFWLKPDELLGIEEFDHDVWIVTQP